MTSECALGLWDVPSRDCKLDPAKRQCFAQMTKPTSFKVWRRSQNSMPASRQGQTQRRDTQEQSSIAKGASAQIRPCAFEKRRNQRHYPPISERARQLKTKDPTAAPGMCLLEGLLSPKLPVVCVCVCALFFFWPGSSIPKTLSRGSWEAPNIFGRGLAKAHAGGWLWPQAKGCTSRRNSAG